MSDLEQENKTIGILPKQEWEENLRQKISEKDNENKEILEKWLAESKNTKAERILEIENDAKASHVERNTPSQKYTDNNFERALKMINETNKIVPKKLIDLINISIDKEQNS